MRLGMPAANAAWVALLYSLGTPVLFRTAHLNHNLLVGDAGITALLLLWDPGNRPACAGRAAFKNAAIVDDRHLPRQAIEGFVGEIGRSAALLPRKKVDQAAPQIFVFPPGQIRLGSQGRKQCFKRAAIEFPRLPAAGNLGIRFSHWLSAKLYRIPVRFGKTSTWSDYNLW